MTESIIPDGSIRNVYKTSNPRLFCRGLLFLNGLFENYHVGQLQEVVVRPNVEFALVDDVRDHIGLHGVDVGFGNTFL